jgi:hypothetical protein
VSGDLENNLETLLIVLAVKDKKLDGVEGDGI